MMGGKVINSPFFSHCGANQRNKRNRLNDAMQHLFNTQK